MYLYELSPESDKFDRLPRACMSREPSTGKPILILRGQSGFYSVAKASDVDRFNRERDITEFQITAMELGAAFGWECDGADPATHQVEYNERLRKASAPVAP